MARGEFARGASWLAAISTGRALAPAAIGRRGRASQGIRPVPRAEANQQSAGPRRVVPGLHTVARTPAGQVSKDWEITMRNALVTIALAALLGLIGDVRQPAAQFGQPQFGQPP